MSPSSVSTYLNLARVSLASKIFAEAAANYEKVLSLEPKNFDGLSGAVNVLNRQKQFVQAHAKVDKAITEQGEDKKFYLLFTFSKAKFSKLKRIYRQPKAN